jgi:NADH dehydrogenase
VAQAGIQQGINLAENFKRMSANKSLKPFYIIMIGSMAIIGKIMVVDLPKPKCISKDFAEWIIWLFIHLISLINIATESNLFQLIAQDQSLRISDLIKVKQNLNKRKLKLYLMNCHHFLI